VRHLRAPVLSACAFVLVLLWFAAPVQAVDPTQMPTPELQARYLQLTHEFRCPVCQSETLADSQEQYAAEVRQQIRTMLLAGKSDDQIRDYLVSRYSEFILFKPEYSLRNAWLWLSPVALLIIGVVVALRIIRTRAALVGEDDSEADEEGLREPLDSPEPPPRSKAEAIDPPIASRAASARPSPHSR
jgi:cytochrome c-type biogenesis protein CcmH